MTRAALDQDMAAIDEAENVIAQKEHKLERLLTQNNIFSAVLVCSTRFYALIEGHLLILHPWFPLCKA